MTKATKISSSSLPATAGSAPAKSKADLFMESIQSVQEFKPKAAKQPWPLWRKVATWFLILTPVMAISIYIGGFFFFLAHDNIGINASLPANVAAVVDGISVPDHTGVFLQTGTNPKQPIKEILQYNGRELQPPESAQVILTPDDLRYVLVRQSQVTTPDTYKIYRIGQGTDIPVAVAAQRVNVPHIALIALTLPAGQRWQPGNYMIIIPDLDSGQYWSFFTVR